MACSQPGPSVHGIVQARILSLSDPGIKPASPALQADSSPLKHPGSPTGFCGRAPIKAKGIKTPFPPLSYSLSFSYVPFPLSPPPPSLLPSIVSFLYSFLPSLICLSLSFWDHREQKTTFLLWQKVKRYNLKTLRDKLPNSWTNVSIVREIKPPRGIKQRWEAETLRAFICLVHIPDPLLPSCLIDKTYSQLFCLSLLNFCFLKIMFKQKGYPS